MSGGEADTPPPGYVRAPARHPWARYMCARCTCLCVDTDTHDAWHARMRKHLWARLLGL